jgi:hypothetical protein
VKRTFISTIVSAALIVAPLPAMSADTGPLPAAPAAGVKQAQGADNNPPVLWLVGAGVVIGLGILILANNNNSNGTTSPQPPGTTTTSTGV